ncbi:hypothetical protein OSB04_014528 [Centaurea solstitialis]|uniref:Uncharacterized protein n=1 Tax=Centaurea solstitialis TaxID=347529 RepID=A0AA38SXG4_9ASTR|nr:hypothetical protein OSB04_014528 [Centaurea solstitialis]
METGGINLHVQPSSSSIQLRHHHQNILHVHRSSPISRSQSQHPHHNLPIIRGQTSHRSRKLRQPWPDLAHPNLKIFTFSELKTATRSFRSDTVLHEGGFGKVYKGWLEDKSNSTRNVIAVKKLSSESLHGLEEWQVKCSKVFLNLDHYELLWDL